MKYLLKNTAKYKVGIIKTEITNLYSLARIKTGEPYTTSISASKKHFLFTFSSPSIHNSLPSVPPLPL